MAELRQIPRIYRLKQTILASGRVYERGVAGTAEDFGDVFHPLRTAGYLDLVDLPIPGGYLVPGSALSTTK